jgi:hypothetical protein
MSVIPFSLAACSQNSLVAIAAWRFPQHLLNHERSLVGEDVREVGGAPAQAFGTGVGDAHPPNLGFNLGACRVTIPIDGDT